jgi:gas vesicle protein
MSDNDSDGDFGAFLAGFVIGGLVGAAVTLIFAPQSGKETRSQITGRGQDLVDATEQRYYSAVESAEVYAQQAGARATQLGQDVSNQARIILDSGRESVSKADENGSASPADPGDETESI